MDNQDKAETRRRVRGFVDDNKPLFDRLEASNYGMTVSELQDFKALCIAEVVKERMEQPYTELELSEFIREQFSAWKGSNP